MGASRPEHTFEKVQLRETETAPGGASTPYAGGLDADKERLMSIVLDPLPTTERERLDLSSALASERMERAIGNQAVDAFTLMNALVWVSTKRGLYYAEPAFVRFLYADWCGTTVERVRADIAELVGWGEIVVHPELAINCYGGNHDIIEIVNRRRFRRFRARPGIPAAVKAEVFARDGGKCLHCGTSDSLSVDHVVPWSRGGAHDITNFQTLCRPCNSRKGARF